MTTLIPSTFKTETSVLVKQAFEFTITDKPTFDQASIITGNLKTLYKLIEEHKNARVKPINQSLKLIREDYKPNEAQLDKAIDMLKK
jgi:hypothetical protein